MEPSDVGGVHVKYLYHCRRQLWLYARGLRPEHLNAAVQLGEAVHDVSYPRASPVDLGAAQLDHVDGRHWVHEVKSSGKATEADRAQAIHYCYRLHEFGIPAQGAVLHYPKTRRTTRFTYNADGDGDGDRGGDGRDRAEADIAEVLAVVRLAQSPPRLARSSCRGCSFADYCWSE